MGLNRCLPDPLLIIIKAHSVPFWDTRETRIIDFIQCHIISSSITSELRRAGCRGFSSLLGYLCCLEFLCHVAHSGDLPDVQMK